MKKLLVTTLLLATCFMFSQNSAFIPTAVFTNTAAISTCSGDFNNDGKSDYLVINTGVIACFLQTTSNSFNQVNSSPGGFAWHLTPTTADYNNDGNLDAAVSDLYTGTLKIYLGQGNGSFTSMNSNQTAGWDDCYSKDFNNDGNKDIAYVKNSNLSILLGQGNGNFNSPVNYSSGNSTYVIKSLGNGDFNNDGITDLVCALDCPGTTPTYSFCIFQGFASGNFNAPLYFSLPSSSNYIHAEDLNSDGNMDVALSFTNQIINFYGNGNNSFSSNSTIMLNNTIRLNSTDFNNDGKRDLISLKNPAFGTIQFDLFFNSGTTTLQSGTSFSFATSGTVIGDLVVDDFNNDLKSEIAINTYSGSAQAVILFSNVNAIYPGDANSDGIANNNDILELGLHTGLTGAARTPTSNAWNSFTCTPWTGTITTGKNMNHSDCNGDGIINLSDTLAVFNNYGFMHSLKESAPTATPQISIVPDQAIVFKNNWGTASIYVGEATTPVNNINGLAFTVSFNKTLIQPDSVYIEYIPSFINSNNLYFRKRIFNNGEIYTATTHTVNNNVSGNGKIAILHYKIKPNLVSDSTLNLGIIKASKMDAGGNLSSLTSGSGTLTASASALGLTEFNSDASVIVFPNPNNGIVTISSSQSLINSELYIYNSLGQEVFKTKLTNQQQTLNLNLAKGIYSYKIQQENRLVKQNKIVVE